MPFPKEKGEFEVFLEQKKKFVPQKKKIGRVVNKSNSTELLYKVFFLRREEEGKWFLRGKEERKRRKGKEMKWVVKIIPKI